MESCPFCNYVYGSTWKNNRGRTFVRKKTKDHIVPLIRGGNDSPDNIIECCYRCNSFKGDLLLHEWRDLIAKALANIDPQQGVIKIKGETNLLIHYKLKDLKIILESINKML